MIPKAILILLFIVLLIIYIIMFYKIYKLKEQHEKEKKALIAMFKIGYELRDRQIKKLENQLMEVKNEN